MRKRFLFGLLSVLVVTAAIRMLTIPEPIRSRPTPNPPAVKLSPAAKTVPPSWERHEYNGGEYYIIPLA